MTTRLCHGKRFDFVGESRFEQRMCATRATRRFRRKRGDSWWAQSPVELEIAPARRGGPISSLTNRFIAPREVGLPKA